MNPFDDDTGEMPRMPLIDERLDDQRIEAILMFSPDYQFFDAAHRPIAIPPDRVVPPELAPQGLPIRRIVVPAPVDGRRS